MREFSVREGATEILLIRHAEAYHPDAANKDVSHQTDLPLTERGIVQANALAKRLQPRGVAAIYSSPLRRAIETAAPLAALAGLTVSMDSRLREVEIAGIGPIALHDLAAIAMERGGWSHLAGTETSLSIRARMGEAIDEAVRAHPGERVAMVSHAGALNAYVARLLELNTDFFFPAGNSSITTIRARGDKRIVMTINDIAHLETLRGTANGSGRS